MSWKRWYLRAHFLVYFHSPLTGSRGHVMGSARSSGTEIFPLLANARIPMHKGFSDRPIPSIDLPDLQGRAQFRISAYYRFLEGNNPLSSRPFSGPAPMSQYNQARFIIYLLAYVCVYFRLL